MKPDKHTKINEWFKAGPRIIQGGGCGCVDRGGGFGGR